MDYTFHPQIRNKPARFLSSYAFGWQRHNGSLEDLRSHVLEGKAFIAAAMSSGHRTSEAFKYADLAVVDVDYGLTTAQLLEHPLAAQACFSYSTASHDPENGKHRFRVIFRLPERVYDADLYKAIVTILTRSLGGDESCKDPCRIWYGYSAGELLIWAPEASLPDEILDDGHALGEKSKVVYDTDAPDVDENSLQRAIFVLEQIIEPTADGERDRFLRVSAAAKAAGADIFPTWSDWASRGHHGSGSKSRQSGERWFNGLKGTSLGSLFYFASEADPDWRSKLPEELRVDSRYTGNTSSTFAGYAHSDFMGEPDEAPSKEPAYGLFAPAQPWAKVAMPAHESPPGHADADFMGEPEDTPVPNGGPLCESSLPDEGLSPSYEQEPDQHPGYQDSDFMGHDAPPDGFPKPKTAKSGRTSQRTNQNKTDEILVDIVGRYPNLRRNTLTQKIEWGPYNDPKIIDDPTKAYVFVNRVTGKNHPEKTVTDILKVQAEQNSFNPVSAYLEHCSHTAEPCPYFDRLASELLGVPHHPIDNPKLEDGQLLMDVVLQRFLIGAVARALQPGCPMDFMLILVGPQGIGKTRFFQCLTPPGPTGTYPWAPSLQGTINTLSEKPHKLHCGWIVILDETDRHFDRNHAEIFKNLVSVSTDISDRKYEHERDFKRGFVLAGATNSDAFLNDSTGSRRFVPLRVGGMSPDDGKQQRFLIDLDRVERDRDSIWAAAHQAYLAHKDDSHPPQLFTQEEAELLKSYTEGFVEESPYVGLVERYVLNGNCGKVEAGNKIVALDLVMEAIGIQPNQSQHCKRSVTDALKTLGFVSKREIGANKKRHRVWVCPLPSSFGPDNMPTDWEGPHPSKPRIGGRA